MSAKMCSFCNQVIENFEKDGVQITADIQYHKEPCLGIVNEKEGNKLREIEMKRKESEGNGGRHL